MGRDINQEIEDMAGQMEKSTKTPVEILFDTIAEVGPEGLRKALPTLNEDEKKVLYSALEEMKKAVSMDDEYQARYFPGKVKKTVIQEDRADDDQDEKLMKPEAAKFDHQGTPTDGWQGQVIKAKSKEPKEMPKMSKEMKEEQDKKKEDMEKCGGGMSQEGMYKKQGVPAGVDPEKQERCVRKLKGQPGKNPYAICNASMKKGEFTPEVKNALDEIKKSVEEQLKEFGVEATPELVKSEMKRLLKEEDQLGDAPDMSKDKTRADKKQPESMDLGEDNKDAQKEVNDLKQGQEGDMKKGKKPEEKSPKELDLKEDNEEAQEKVNDMQQGKKEPKMGQYSKKVKKAIWGEPNDLIKAKTGGRNHHFSVNEFYDEVLKNSDKPATEEIKKGFTEPKEDLNEIIAKGEDRTSGHIECDRLVKSVEAKKTGKLVKSFEDKEIAEALGLTEEEAKKILG